MIQYISNLNRLTKQLIVLISDILICFFTLYLAFYLRIESIVELNNKNILFFFISFAVFIPIFIIFGLYNFIFRYLGFATYLRVVYAIFTYSIIFFIIINYIKLENIPRSAVIIQSPIFIISIIFFRLLISYIFKRKGYEKINNKIAIYGNSNEMIDYIQFLKNHFYIEIIFDKDSKNIGKKFDGYKILSPNNLINDLKKNNLYKLFVIENNFDNKNRENLLSQFKDSNIVLKFLPSYSEFILNPSLLNYLNKVNFEDIIKNKILYETNEDLIRFFQNKNVLITGAGGSIGSQLSKEISKYKIKNLILLDNSEYNLYKIKEELNDISSEINIVALLANIYDYKSLIDYLSNQNIDYIFHSAAFKHVPLLEDNIIEAAKNNIIGTYNIAKLTQELAIPNCLLVSTDKAVRPTNVMGASKRIAENIFQAYGSKYENTNYSIVRFGNVVNSKGSVLPMFSKQIENRLPIKLTHIDVERYFMTIPDATKLIIEISCKKSQKTPIYFLDMGNPIKILDIIKLMLKVNGLKFKKNIYDNDGDIFLEVIGLRPGEKIKEELSISKKYSKDKKNSNIYICYEEFKNLDRMNFLISELVNLINENNSEQILKFLEKNVEDYSRLLN